MKYQNNNTKASSCIPPLITYQEDIAKFMNKNMSPNNFKNTNKSEL